MVGEKTGGEEGEGGRGRLPLAQESAQRWLAPAGHPACPCRLAATLHPLNPAALRQVSTFVSILSGEGHLQQGRAAGLHPLRRRRRRRTVLAGCKPPTPIPLPLALTDPPLRSRQVWPPLPVHRGRCVEGLGGWAYVFVGQLLTGSGGDGGWRVGGPCAGWCLAGTLPSSPPHPHPAMPCRRHPDVCGSGAGLGAAAWGLCGACIQAGQPGPALAPEWLSKGGAPEVPIQPSPYPPRCGTARSSRGWSWAPSSPSTTTYCPTMWPLECW